jgi:hypothetical protein
MTLAAWIGALAVGVTLGLLGSGGSIVTVPVLVYLLHQPEKVAIAGSLGIVGGIAVVGGGIAAIRRRVDLRSVVLFGLPGMAGTYGGAWLAGFVTGATQLIVFALVMLLAAGFMLRPRPAPPPADGRSQGAPAVVLAIEGLGVGALTGFVGVGGGFLIVPALVLLGRLPMHVAVGTSLAIIALKSFAGFWKYLDVLAEAGLALDWRVIVTFTAVGAVGSLGGNLIGGYIPQARLQRVFAAFLIAVGAFILWQSAPRLL